MVSPKNVKVNFTSQLYGLHYPTPVASSSQPANFGFWMIFSTQLQPSAFRFFFISLATSYTLPATSSGFRSQISAFRFFFPRHQLLATLYFFRLPQTSSNTSSPYHSERDRLRFWGLPIQSGDSCDMIKMLVP